MSLQVTKKPPTTTKRCQSCAIDLPAANISAVLSGVLTLTDVVDGGADYLPVDGPGSPIRAERRTVGFEREGVEEGRLLGDPRCSGLGVSSVSQPSSLLQLQKQTSDKHN